MLKNYVEGYPRPQLVRGNWESLDGPWSFIFAEDVRGDEEKCAKGFEIESPVHEIIVPFSYETKASGIGETRAHNSVWYERRVHIGREEGERVLLHFEGADYETRVFVNGKFAGEHRGACERFTLDITALTPKRGDIRLVVNCRDSWSKAQPRGKQRWEKDSFGCWYVQTTGIWKSVWMETVPEAYIESLKLTPDLSNAQIIIDARIHAETWRDLPISRWDSCVLSAEVSYEGERISLGQTSLIREDNDTLRAHFSVSVMKNDSCPDGFWRWSPEHPALYDLRLNLCGEMGMWNRNSGTGSKNSIDEVRSYFGMREIRTDKGHILLNGSPLYLRMILDQGYWPQSGLTPPDEKALVTDIDNIHALGFNALRKHQKIEDERFLFWCDVKGMLVWSEMAATYEFSDRAVRNFTDEWLQILQQNYSHPSIIAWTPFNESWGIPNVKTSAAQQAFTEGIYYLTKSFDPQRPVITNDGWEHTCSDIVTLHDYEADGDRFFERYRDFDAIASGNVYHCGHKSAFADGFAYHGQPVIISEYGGIAFTKKGEGEWGYGESVADEAAFLTRFEKSTDAIKALPYCCGYCYTQATDVEQEVNGLMTPDRKFKISPEKIRKINEKTTAFH